MKKEKIIGVYQITNIIDGKIYIGHSEDIIKRWGRHRIGKGSLLLGNAIKKHGLENFKFEILEEINNDDKTNEQLKTILYQREQYYLDLKQSYVKSVGYNIDKIAKYNNSGTRSDEFKSNIRRINLEGNFTGKKVFQYDLKGNFIMEWKSAAEIERCLGFKAENISACCLGKQSHSNEFIWLFELCEITEDKIKKIFSGKRLTEVRQYNFKGELLNIFLSTKDASEKTGININIIREACGGHKKTGAGFIWKFKNEELFIEKHLKRDIIVKQYTLDGVLIKTWDSLTELIKTTKFSSKYIKECSDGVRKSYNGFKWERII